MVESGHRRKVKKYCLQTGHYANELISKPMLAVCKLFASADPLRNQTEAIRTTIVPISSVIRTTVVPISGVIGPTVVRIANATGIGYRHDGSIRFSNKLTYALNF